MLRSYKMLLIFTNIFCQKKKKKKKHSGLGLQSIAFDLIFMVQHYILYRNYKDKSLNTVDEERRRLIIEGRVPRVDEEDDEYL